MFDQIEKGSNPQNLVVKSHGGQTIDMETNFQILDGHLGETGHKILCDFFYDHIKTNKFI